METVAGVGEGTIGVGRTDGTDTSGGLYATTGAGGRGGGTGKASNSLGDGGRGGAS